MSCSWFLWGCWRHREWRRWPPPTPPEPPRYRRAASAAVAWLGGPSRATDRARHTSSRGRRSGPSFSVRQGFCPHLSERARPGVRGSEGNDILLAFSRQSSRCDLRVWKSVPLCPCGSIPRHLPARNVVPPDSRGLASIDEGADSALPPYILVKDGAMDSFTRDNPTLASGVDVLRTWLGLHYETLRSDVGGTWYLRADLSGVVLPQTSSAGGRGVSMARTLLSRPARSNSV